MFRAKPKPEVPDEIGGLRVRLSARTRRLGLRVDAKTGEVFLVWPARGSSREHALRFVNKYRGWIEAQESRRVPLRDFCDGESLSIMGKTRTIIHREGRGLTRIEGEAIIVHGARAHLHRRVRDFLKKHAAEVFAARVRQKNEILGLQATEIRVIDPKTRWGSCSPDGRLMFSWRVILAPEEVLDYLVAHEVAHRVHLNHSRKFWALCFSLCGNGASSRRWLKQNGQQLMRYR